MTELNTFNALKQERKAIIHSGAGLPWDGLAQLLIYIQSWAWQVLLWNRSLVFNCIQPVPKVV